MEKLIDLVKKNQVAIGVGAAAVAAIGALYLFSKGTPAAQETTKGDDEKPVSQSEYEKKADDIVLKINKKTLPENKNYDLNTIFQILELSLDLAKDEYAEFTLKNREERRKFMKADFENYEKLIIEYNDYIEVILKKAQNTILEKLNISVEDFEESVITFMENGHYQEIYMLQAAIRQKIKEKIKPTKNLTLENLKAILTYQHEILQQKPELLNNLLAKLSQNPETAALIPTIFHIIINDYIYQEFQVEEEDQMSIITNHINDPDIIILI